MPSMAGDRVGDFGFGTGAYTRAIHARLGQEGSVYAFEVFPPHVDALHRECVSANARNLFPLYADLNSSIPLQDSFLHTSIVANTLHALTRRERFLSELHRVLRPKGRVLFVDWASSFKNIGPSEEAVISPGDAVRLFKAHGFGTGDMLPAGTHHYAFIATKQ